PVAAIATNTARASGESASRIREPEPSTRQGRWQAPRDAEVLLRTRAAADLRHSGRANRLHEDGRGAQRVLGLAFDVAAQITRPSDLGGDLEFQQRFWLDQVHSPRCPAVVVGPLVVTQPKLEGIWIKHRFACGELVPTRIPPANQLDCRSALHG